MVAGCLIKFQHSDFSFVLIHSSEENKCILLMCLNVYEVFKEYFIRNYPGPNFFGDQSREKYFASSCFSQ